MAIDLSYRCTICSVEGVKLWREWGACDKLFCGRCATEQAGLQTDDLDENGTRPSRYNPYTRTDQVHGPKGATLLPAVLSEHLQAGLRAFWTYGYIPSDAAEAWRALPTRLPCAEPPAELSDVHPPGGEQERTP